MDQFDSQNLVIILVILEKNGGPGLRITITLKPLPCLKT
jgi:hypothetical protein